LLKDFRGGADGRVWLVCSTAGNVGVIKFSQNPDRNKGREDLNNEASHWERVWNIPCRVVTLGGDPALLMPYIKPVFEPQNPSQKFSDLPEESRQEIEQAISHMASLKLVHDDLSWRHVGFISPAKKGQKKRVVFYDLHRVKDVEDKQKAEQEMKRQLNMIS